MATPAISILMPTYNGAAFLSAQIASIRAQSLPDWELLVVDDGSTDASVAIARAAAADDRRIVILAGMDNRGQRQRLVALAAAARASLFAISDQDDVWDADKLARLFTGIGRATLAYGRSRLIGADGADLGFDLLDGLGGAPEPGDRLCYLFRPAVSAHAMLIRRDAFTQASLMRAMPFDWLQSIDAAFAGGVAHVPEAVTFHRIHSANQSDNGAVVDRHRRRRHVPPVAATIRLHRWTLCQRLEHLANSSIQNCEVRRMAGRAFELCSNAWLWRREKAAGLAAALADTLAPFAGSAGDRRFANAEIERLCRSPGHPRALLAGLRVLVA